MFASYDAVGNIAGETLTLPTGTDVQHFCYDEQDRLTWAGSVGTPSCTGTAISPGSLTSAQYTQTFSYDTLNRLTSGPLGSYTYGDTAHRDAATSVGTGSGQYTASYVNDVKKPDHVHMRWCLGVKKHSWWRIVPRA
jgi:hypothetical protein